MKLEGKVALVTGGGSGIGAAITERFVAEGAKVCVSGRRQEMLDRVAGTLPPGAVATCRGDTGNEEDVARMIARTLEFGGKIDVLVNNAGIAAKGPVAEADRAAWRHVMDVNLNGPFMLMQEAIPHMIKNGGGSIINIASAGGLRCLPAMPAYCASKAALIMLTQQAALDYGPQGIRCNAVCPGAIKTDMVISEFGQIGKMIGMTPDDFFSVVSKALPLQRFGKPPEVGGVCVSRKRRFILYDRGRIGYRRGHGYYRRAWGNDDGDREAPFRATIRPMDYDGKANRRKTTMRQRRSFRFVLDLSPDNSRTEVRKGRVSVCGRRCVEEGGALPPEKKTAVKSRVKEGNSMPKSIILYNLKQGVSDEDYKKWCDDYKGPFFLSLRACNSFTLLKMMGGIKGDGAKGIPPEGTPPPYKYIGIVDVSSLEEWQKDTETKAFQEEFFAQWFSKWVADFYVLVGQEVYQGRSD
jgi:NAD(P)-dependent dehydrogenase (short-subunit alcohol dehydrogenase family)